MWSELKYEINYKTMVKIASYEKKNFQSCEFKGD